MQKFIRLGIEHDYEILLSSLPKDSRLLKKAASQMIERRVEGAAILTFGEEMPVIELFGDSGVPMVGIDIDATTPLLKTLRIDYRHGIRQAVQHLAALGHTRIALVGGPSA